MKTLTYSFTDLLKYLKSRGYHPTYRKGIYDAFYNPRSRKHLLIPFVKEIFLEEDIVGIFSKNQATDLPAKLEWFQFRIFIHNSI